MLKMKRYAVTLALVLLVAASMGTYYAYGANPHLPEYRLQTLEGDPAEAAALTLEGSFVGGKGSYMLKVTTEGSEYGNGSLWHQLLTSGSTWMSDYYSDICELFREHKQFMRGKDNLSGFYQDRNTAIYANASVVLPDRSVRWTVDILPQSGGKRTSIMKADPLGQINYAAVEDVQKIGDEVHVLTFLPEEGGPTEYRDEVFDVSTGKPSHSIKMQMWTPSAPDREVSVITIADTTPTAPNPQAVLVVSERSTVSAATGMPAAATSNGLPKVFSTRVYAYDYATGDMKLVPVDLGDTEDGNDFDTINQLSGNLFESLYRTSDAVSLQRYDLRTSIAGPAVTIHADQIGEGQIGSALLANGRIYLLVRTDGMNDLPTVAVADADDGRILYKGQPVCVDPNGRPADQVGDVWLGNLSLR